MIVSGSLKASLSVAAVILLLAAAFFEFGGFVIVPLFNDHGEPAMVVYQNMAAYAAIGLVLAIVASQASLAALSKRTLLPRSILPYKAAVIWCVVSYSILALPFVVSVIQSIVQPPVVTIYK